MMLPRSKTRGMAREVTEPSTLRSTSCVRAKQGRRVISRYGGFEWIVTSLGFAVQIVYGGLNWALPAA